MTDSISNDQCYILYQLENWNTFRESQNIYIDYRSWSGIFQTLSMFANIADLSLNEIIFLTPIQSKAVELSRSGLWAESFEEFVYRSATIDDDFSEIVKGKYDFSNLHKIRNEILYRSETQVKPKLAIVLNAERLTSENIHDMNKYLRMQTIVCFDSAKYCDIDSMIYSVKNPIRHTFLNEDAGEIQSYLYEIIDKKLVMLNNSDAVRVHEYRKAGHDITKMRKPVFSATPDYSPMKINVGKGSLIYTTGYNWNYSLENNRYYLIKNMYLVIDTMVKRYGRVKLTMHPTYTKYKYRAVQDVKYSHVLPGQLIDVLPPWSFKSGSVVVPKTIKTLEDAKRIYNAVNMFTDSVSLYII